jgi:hypothetical protein
MGGHRLGVRSASMMLGGLLLADFTNEKKEGAVRFLNAAACYQSPGVTIDITDSGPCLQIFRQRSLSCPRFCTIEHHLE